MSFAPPVGELFRNTSTPDGEIAGVPYMPLFSSFAPHVPARLSFYILVPESWGQHTIDLKLRVVGGRGLEAEVGELFVIECIA